MQTNVDPSGQHKPPISLWVNLLIIIRVVMILVLFLALFLAIFLGYFTLPVAMMVIIAVIYMLLDFGWRKVFKSEPPVRPEQEENLSPDETKPDERN